jgi:hypothetical protein
MLQETDACREQRPREEGRKEERRGEGRDWDEQSREQGE